MPAVRGEGDVSGAEGGNKVIFGGPDPSLRGVGAVVGGLTEKMREILTLIV